MMHYVYCEMPSLSPCPLRISAVCCTEEGLFSVMRSVGGWLLMTGLCPRGSDGEMYTRDMNKWHSTALKRSRVQCTLILLSNNYLDANVLPASWFTHTHTHTLNWRCGSAAALCLHQVGDQFKLSTMRTFRAAAAVRVTSYLLSSPWLFGVENGVVDWRDCCELCSRRFNSTSD